MSTSLCWMLWNVQRKSTWLSLLNTEEFHRQPKSTGLCWTLRNVQPKYTGLYWMLMNIHLGSSRCCGIYISCLVGYTECWWINRPSLLVYTECWGIYSPSTLGSSRCWGAYIPSILGYTDAAEKIARVYWFLLDAEEYAAEAHWNANIVTGPHATHSQITHLSLSVSRREEGLEKYKHCMAYRYTIDRGLNRGGMTVGRGRHEAVGQIYGSSGGGTE